jgi:hypothetical protein
MDDLPRQWLLANTKQCGNRGNYIEKRDGCNSMECLVDIAFAFSVAIKAVNASVPCLLGQHKKSKFQSNITASGSECGTNERMGGVGRKWRGRENSDQRNG